MGGRSLRATGRRLGASRRRQDIGSKRRSAPRHGCQRSCVAMCVGRRRPRAGPCARPSPHPRLGAQSAFGFGPVAALEAACRTALPDHAQKRSPCELSCLKVEQFCGKRPTEGCIGHRAAQLRSLLSNRALHFPPLALVRASSSSPGSRSMIDPSSPQCPYRTSSARTRFRSCRCSYSRYAESMPRGNRLTRSPFSALVGRSRLPMSRAGNSGYRVQSRA